MSKRMSMEKYVNTLYEIHEKMSGIVSVAQKENAPVSKDFYTLQDNLIRTARNARAFCRRHDIDVKEYNCVPGLW